MTIVIPFAVLLVLYTITLLFALNQFRSPYRFRNWELAWGCKVAACAVLILRRLYVWWFWLQDWPPGMDDVVELWLSFPFAILFFLANFYHARVYMLPVALKEFPPAMIRINSASRVLTWDAAAQVLFGYTALEALGKDLADLIIPQQHQEEHRAGVRRFLAGEQTSRIVGRTIQTTACHKDGTEFPVEVRVDALPTLGGMDFVGSVRKLIRL